MTPPIRKNAYPKKKFNVPWTFVQFVARNLWGRRDNRILTNNPAALPASLSFQ
jgi:hypothetical protein